MMGQVVSIQESSQVEAVRERLASLRSFFDTFATAEWLGQLFAMQDFRKELDIVLGLLNGLLDPPKKALPDLQALQVTQTQVHNELSAVRQKLQQKMMVKSFHEFRNNYNNYNRGYAQHEFPETPPAHLRGSARKEWSDLWLQWRDLNILREQADNQQWQQSQSWQSHQWQQSRGCPTKLPNPLSAHISGTTSEFASKPVLEQLQCLTNMCSELKGILQEDEKKKHEMQMCLQVKMSNLADFAEVLNDIAGIVKRYVLTRLADIGKDDLSIVKKWITEEEATEVHRMLEAFRDDAIQELATRAAMKKMFQKKQSDSSWQFVPGSDSAATVKEYLFQNSVGCAQGQRIEEVNEVSISAGSEPSNEVSKNRLNEVSISASSVGPPSADNSKQRLSKHQRERRAKFWKAIPKTPSDMTCQS